MKLIGLRKFQGRSLDDVVKYLRVDVSKTFEDLFTVLLSPDSRDIAKTFTLGPTPWATSSAIGIVGTFSLGPGDWLISGQAKIDTFASTVTSQPGSALVALSGIDQLVEGQIASLENIAINAGANGTDKTTRLALPTFFATTKTRQTFYGLAVNQYGTAAGAKNTIYVTAVNLRRD
jgi:hypothetical protein